MAKRTTRQKWARMVVAAGVFSAGVGAFQVAYERLSTPQSAEAKAFEKFFDVAEEANVRYNSALAELAGPINASYLQQLTKEVPDGEIRPPIPLADELAKTASDYGFTDLLPGFDIIAPGTRTYDESKRPLIVQLEVDYRKSTDVKIDWGVGSSGTCLKINNYDTSSRYNAASDFSSTLEQNVLCLTEDHDELYIKKMTMEKVLKGELWGTPEPVAPEDERQHIASLVYLINLANGKVKEAALGRPTFAEAFKEQIRYHQSL